MSKKTVRCLGWPPHEHYCRNRVSADGDALLCPECAKRHTDSLKRDLRYILQLEAQKQHDRGQEAE